MNKVALIAVVLMAATVSSCSSIQSERNDYFEVYEDSIPLLSNDTVAECSKTKKSYDTFCILISGKVSEERIGKVLAYGLLLDKAGWFNFEPPMEEFVSADTLKTPDYVNMYFRKTEKTKCKKELILTPRTLSGTDKTELSISKQNLDCNK